MVREFSELEFTCDPETHKEVGFYSCDFVDHSSTYATGTLRVYLANGWFDIVSKLLIIGAINMSIRDSFTIVNTKVSNIFENESRAGCVSLG